MVQFGNGFSITELYNIPTRLRVFYYNKLVEAKKKESEEIEKNNKQANKVRVKR
jgi:hypothetical protein